MFSHIDTVQVEIELIEFLLNNLINLVRFSSQKFDIVMGLMFVLSLRKRVVRVTYQIHV